MNVNGYHLRVAAVTLPMDGRMAPPLTPAHHGDDRTVGHGEAGKFPTGLAEHLYRAHDKWDLAVRSSDLGHLHHGEMPVGVGRWIELAVGYLACGNGQSRGGVGTHTWHGSK
jgi:hypothetical protein